MSADKTNAMRILDRAGICYNVHSYEVTDGRIDGLAIAEKVGQNPELVYKTLVTQGSSRNYYVFVIPVAEELNLKAAAKAVGEKSVEMIKVADINKVTGYIRGDCSPVGMKKQFKTVAHETAAFLDRFFVSGGKIGLQIEVSPNELAELIDMSFSHIVH